MDFDFSLEFEELKEQERKANVRAKTAQAKHKAAKFEPTWEQVWHGYEKPNSKGGTTKKKGILQMSNSERDQARLIEIKRAVENGKLELTVPMSKVSKSYCLNELYPQYEKSLRKERMAEIIKHKPHNYYLITEIEQLEKLANDLKDEMETAVDTETTGLDVYVDRMVGMSITLPKHNYHVYIPFGHTTGERQLPKVVVLKTLEFYLKRKNDKKFLHNVKFDRHMFIREGYDLLGTIHDTQVAQQVLNENEPSKRLKVLLTTYKDFLGFEEDSYTYDQLFGDKYPFARVPLDIACAYACKDTHGTYKLGKWQEEFFKKQPKLGKVFYGIETPLLPNVVDMERNGMLIDKDFAADYSKELAQELKEMESKLRAEMGEVNINSPQQLQVWLYDEKKLDDISGSRKTDKKTLKVLAEEEPILGLLLKYKDLYKLWSTYISAIPQKVKDDGRIHGQFNQDKTDTGRFSSQEPNLQNFPPRARQMVVAPKGKILVSIDFSQIEPRFLSHITQDEEFMKVYREGRDLYSYLASRVFKLPLEQCGDGSKYRKMMKTGLLAVMYGTSTWTLSKQLEIPVEEAEQFIKDFYMTYPSVKRWIQSVYAFVKENEYVQDQFGRKRRFPHHAPRARKYDEVKQTMCEILGVEELPNDYWDWKKYPQLPKKLKAQFKAVKRVVERERRQAVNFLIQGASASIMKLAINKVCDYLKQKGKEWKLIGTVHDENILEIPATVTKEELCDLYDCMRCAVELRVPLKCDLEIMERWGHGFKFDVNRKVFFLVDEKTGKTVFEVETLEEALAEFKKVA
ncbi:DNA polymerase [Weizmannia sp. CD-2023]|uniref:DNA polymerase n=1 Tax=Heyndrickxia TaxID=2837504 RepID=UPI002E1AD575|nr:DNA polymerase [Weizmannia sp. CD-2023]MED4841546.1 DNA polymerase [Weizmannia sp. CD-2023]MED4899773.1 DNA polymerase [Weizmannia sp. CD-2023]